ncbi:hypothetical protein CPB85DRAFT_1443241 [Mucidula mucida]|nr:hypothetical protein CPB85DRAFT_1443241 [Mucidula mucida]
MASAEELEKFAFQIAAKLRNQRLENEAARRVEEAHRPPPLPRPTGKSEDFREFSVILMGQWVPGPDMGPVLPPRHAMTLGPITVNPMLAFPFTDQRRFRWDVRLSFEDAKYVTPDRQISISLPNARLQPATAPRITRLSIISESFPWSLTVNARTASAGVTVYDVLHNISRFLRLDLAERDLRDTSPTHRAAIIEANRTRTSQSMGPGDIRLLDWLLSATKFGGLAHKPNHVSTGLLASEEAFFVLYFEE